MRGEEGCRLRHTRTRALPSDPHGADSFGCLALGGIGGPYRWSLVKRSLSLVKWSLQALCDLITECWAHRRQDRPSTARILARLRDLQPDALPGAPSAKPTHRYIWNAFTGLAPGMFGVVSIKPTNGLYSAALSPEIRTPPLLSSIGLVRAVSRRTSAIEHLRGPNPAQLPQSFFNSPRRLE